MRRYGVLLSLLLGLWPRARHPSACVRLGDLSVIAQINLVLKTLSYYLQTEEWWEPPCWWTLGEGTFVCLGPPCKVMNQSIVGLSPSSETTYPTGHDIPLWWNFVKIIISINCLYNLIVIVAYLVMVTSTRTWAKMLKVRIHYLAAFWQTNPQAKSLAWLEVKSFF
jgi:hypothetical protein